MTDNKKWNEWYEAAGQSASTTMVGQFAEGNSAANVSDLSGNVWEWTNSWYDKTQRAIRGGSWVSNRRNARCADRFRNVPGNFLGNVGFRLFSPGS
jgi:formylglycine-generating enzyme required for sulfatase activity